jgi:hypothetical protein
MLGTFQRQVLDERHDLKTSVTTCSNGFLIPDIVGWSPSTTSSSAYNSPAPTPPTSPGESSVECETPKGDLQTHEYVYLDRHTPSHHDSRVQYPNLHVSPTAESFQHASFPHRLQQGSALDATDPVTYGYYNASSQRPSPVIPAITLIPPTPNPTIRVGNQYFPQESNMDNYNPTHLAEGQTSTHIHNYSDPATHMPGFYGTPVQAGTATVDGTGSTRQHINSPSSSSTLLLPAPQTSRRQQHNNHQSSVVVNRNKLQRGTRIAKPRHGRLSQEELSIRADSKASDPNHLRPSPEPRVSMPSMDHLPRHYSFHSYTVCRPSLFPFILSFARN